MSPNNTTNTDTEKSFAARIVSWWDNTAKIDSPGSQVMTTFGSFAVIKSQKW